MRGYRIRQLFGGSGLKPRASHLSSVIVAEDVERVSAGAGEYC